MTNSTHNSDNWHEKRPELSRGVSVLSSLPEEIQAIVANGLIRMAEGELKSEEVANELKSLGVEKTLGLYNGKNKCDAYNYNSVMQRALSHMYVLSEEKQDLMAKQMLSMMDHYMDYLKTCKELRCAPSTKALAQITNLFIQEGAADASRFVTHIKAQLEKRAQIQLAQQPQEDVKTETETEQPENKQERLRASGHGMRISLD